MAGSVVEGRLCQVWVPAKLTSAHSGPSSSQVGTSPITSEEIFASHEGGKLSVVSKSPLTRRRDLSIAYTPGVSEASRAVAADPAMANTHTWAGRLVAVVSDGSAVLGLGDIGPAAALPVMEGKAALFKTFANLDSIPIVLDTDTQDVDEIVQTVKLLRPAFGAVNLEDISAPRCFQIEQRLIEELDIPVMHDDLHGTAVVALAALLNATKVVGKDLGSLKVAVAGAGAAGIAIIEILLAEGIQDIVLLDARGIVSRDREDLDTIKTEDADRTNPRRLTGNLHGRTRRRRNVDSRQILSFSFTYVRTTSARSAARPRNWGSAPLVYAT